MRDLIARSLYACPSHAVALGAGPTPDDGLRAP
jgi:hypothetical protein